MRKRWEPWELEILKQHYGKMHTKILIQKYLPHRSTEAVGQKARSLNLDATGMKIEDRQKRALVEYYGKMPIREIQAAFFPDRSVGAVYALAKRLKLIPTQSARWKKVVVPPELSETDWAYLAGIIDGEGTITILSSKRKGHNLILLPLIAVSSKNTSLMEWLQRIFQVRWSIRNGVSGFGAPRGLQTRITAYPVVKWVLENIYPYLIIKKKQAQLLLEFLRLREQRRYGSPYTQDDFNIVLELRKMNAGRGKRFELLENSLKQKFEEYLKSMT